MLTDERLIEIRKATIPRLEEWGDTKAFGRAIEAEVLRDAPAWHDAAKTFRDAVLNQRHQLETPCLDNDQTNAVLALFDDCFGPIPADQGEKA